MFCNKKNISLIVLTALYIISFLPEICLAEENEALYPIRKQFEKKDLLVWKQGYMNKQGQVLIEPAFSKVNYFKDGVALVGEQGDWGYIDKNGKIIIEIQYRWATDFSEDLAQVLIRSKENGKTVLQTTFIDKKGDIAINKKFDFNSDVESLFKDGITCIAKDNKWGFINKKGEFVIAPIYEATRNFSQELAPVKKDGKWGFINKEGKFVINPSFESSFPFKENFAAVQIDGKWGFINKKGEVTIKPIYDLMAYDEPRFSEGMARICLHKKWGFINTNGETVIEPVYEFAGNFQDGMAVVKTGGKVGYLDRNGKMKIPAEFISGEDFYQGLAFVMVSLNPDKYAYIDKEGKIIWESD
jgi:hypothetical protein